MSGIVDSKTLSRRALRQLYLTLFLRGFGARGQTKDSAPKSVREKLLGVLAIYAVVGLLVGGVGAGRMPVFAFATWLHALTFAAIGLFVLTTAGETLFNRSEPDTLLHRPVTGRELLRAKAGILITVSLWMAGALNVVGALSGMGAPDGGVLFPVAHAASLVLEVLFCVGSIVLTYQLCMKWFGRERLDAVMTTVQIIASVVLFVASQTLPRLMSRSGMLNDISSSAEWAPLLPPAWFAGFVDAIAGSRSADSWLLAALAVAVTSAVLWMAMNRLASAYEEGLRTVGDAPTPRAPQRASGFVSALSHARPISWGLRDPVARASFRLTVAYLLRDREIKLRVYPGLAPALVMPVIVVLSGSGAAARTIGPFMMAFLGAYMCVIPLSAVSMIEHSQQWQAMDVYRAAPIVGPGAIKRGMRSAVIWLLTVPMLIGTAMISVLLGADPVNLMLLAPGAVLIPVCAVSACTGGRGIPLSLAGDPSKQTGHGLKIMGMMMVAMIVAGIATLAWNKGWFAWFMAVEAAAALLFYTGIRKEVDREGWGLAAGAE
jgi:ABC-2 type transport system permease protein